jgi:opacity protein-like surface antigen
MSAKSMLFLMVAAAVFAGAARADDAGEPVHCSLNDAPAVACRMTDKVDANGTHSMEFVFGTQHARFNGRSQTGWWSGQLDGQPAMGRELNRGHTVYSTVDLKTTFEWWSEGNEHGSY